METRMEKKWGNNKNIKWRKKKLKMSLKIN